MLEEWSALSCRICPVISVVLFFDEFVPETIVIIVILELIGKQKKKII